MVDVFKKMGICSSRIITFKNGYHGSGSILKCAGCGDGVISLYNSQETADSVLKAINNDQDVGIVAIACSGGSDSVFLLHYVCDKFENLKNKLIVLHFNHNLRGADSDEDEEFVKKMACKMGMAFFSEKLSNVPAKVSEEFLRDRRNEFFERALKKFSSRILLLGQQKNDVAETLMMRLSRGSDLSGLSAPKEVTVVKNQYLKLRPLLRFTKREIENQLTIRKILWREDKSNSLNDFFRNKIRNIVLPVFQSSAGKFDVINNLYASHQNIKEANEALDFFFDKYVQDINMFDGLDVATLKRLPTAILKKIFIQFLLVNGAEVRKSYIDFFFNALESSNSRRCSIGNQRFILFKDDKFSFCENTVSENWYISDWQYGTIALPNGQFLKKELVSSDDFCDNLKTINRQNKCYAFVEKSDVISVRQYRSNYRYKPFGHSKEKKLGDVITTKICSKQLRQHLPVIFVNGVVCWTPGLPVSEIFKIKAGDKEALLLTYS